MCRFVFGLLFFFLVHVTSAQKGDYFIVDHAPPDGAIDHTNFSITQDADGFMWIANRKGIVQFDGQEWELFPSASAVFKVVDTPDGIYASGRNLIGRISPDYPRRFVPILASDSLDDVFDASSYRDYVVFMSEHRLSVLDRQTNQVVWSLQRNDLDLNGLFAYQDALLITTDDQVNYVLKESDGTWQFDKNPALDDLGGILSLDGNDEGEYIAINDQGYLLYLNAARDTLMFEETDYVINSIPTEVRWVDSELIVISTLSGGVIFVHTKTQEVEISNYYSGLPENQIYAMAVDRGSGVWVAHAYGFSRIMPLFPIRSFSQIPGIEGNIMSIRNYKGQIYAGSTVGVFALKEIPVYTQRIIYDRVTTSSPSTPTSDKKSKKGLFSFLKKKKQVSESPTSSTSTRMVQRVERELQSVKFRFQPIADIREETNQFIPTQSGLIAGGLSGIFSLNDTVASPITGEPVRYIHYSEGNRMLTASTYNNTVLTFYERNGNWEQTDLLDGLEDFIYHITESGSDLWLAGADSIYRIGLHRGQLADVDVFQLDNDFFDETYSIEEDDRMVFFNRSGYLKLDSLTFRVLQDSALTAQYGVPQQIFISNNRSLWVNNGKNWQIMGSDLPQTNFSFLHAFPNIRQLEFAAFDSSYWIVTYDNHIYNVQPKNNLIASSYHVQLKEAYNNNRPLNPHKVFSIEQDDNHLNFTFIKPDYSRMLGTQYRYRLVGLSDDWSSWSEVNNRINYSYLPPGKYTLEVETRNNFGETDPYEPIRFNVVPPYWRQAWFYALEVILFSSLLIFSIRLNRGSNRYGVLSRLLAFLTLILIVEFVQTIAEYSFETDNSPVIDFFIQVSIALLVLPVESLLRKAIFKGEKPSNQDS